MLAARSGISWARLSRAAHVAESDSVSAASELAGTHKPQQVSLLKLDGDTFVSEALIVLHAPDQGVHAVRWTSDQQVYRALVCPAGQQRTTRGKIDFAKNSVSRAVGSFAEVDAYFLGLGVSLGHTPAADNSFP